MTEEKKIEEGNIIIAEFMEEPHLAYPHGGGAKYHTSWDWLMPVVKKILSMDASPFNVYQLYISDSLRSAEISEVYKSIIAFIESYNQNKTP